MSITPNKSVFDAATVWGVADLNDTSATILGFLLYGPMTGWEISELAGESVEHFWSVTRSQIYRELGSMAGEGLVEAAQVEGRTSTKYSVTTAGEDAFDEWLQAAPQAARIRDPFLIRIFFGSRLDRRLLDDIVTVERIRVQRLLTDLHNRSTGFDAFTQAARAYGIAHYEAVLDWIRNTDWSALADNDTRPNDTRPTEG